MRKPLLVAPLTLLALACASSRHEEASSKPQTQATAPAAENTFEVVHLKNAAAVELAHVLRNAGLPGDVRISPDPRTNSLVLSGPAGDLAAIRALIAELDVSVPAPGAAR